MRRLLILVIKLFIHVRLWCTERDASLAKEVCCNSNDIREEYKVSCLFAEYGSMLSSPSTESHIRSSFDTANNTNELNSKFEATDAGTGSMTENTMFTAHDSSLDVDMHWEMNYHEAAIFLEVTRLLIVHTCFDR